MTQNDKSRLIVGRAEFEELRQTVKLQTLHLAHLDRIFYRWRDEILAEIREAKSITRSMIKRLETAENAIKVIRKVGLGDSGKQQEIRNWKTGRLRIRPLLMREIDKLFTREELLKMSVELLVAYEDIKRDSKLETIYNLIEFCDNRGKLLDLIALCRRERPNGDWPGND